MFQIFLNMNTSITSTRVSSSVNCQVKKQYSLLFAVCNTKLEIFLKISLICKVCSHLEISKESDTTILI